jgi:hypothetical protein
VRVKSTVGASRIVCRPQLGFKQKGGVAGGWPLHLASLLLGLVLGFAVGAHELDELGPQAMGIVPTSLVSRINQLLEAAAGFR